MKVTEKYTGTVYIGVAGGVDEHGPARDSIEQIARRPGDSAPYYYRATKGYEGRQMHINNFINSKHDFILLLDADMTFPAFTLERLRSHELPYISGLYMRRLTDVVAPIWFRPYTGDFPLEPWVGEIERGRLHKLGASGWGCILLHRQVILKTRDLLKGEWDILEDDMDIYPYDLKRIYNAFNGLQQYLDYCKGSSVKADLIPIQAYLDILREEIRVLRADKNPVGSDLRFPFFALQAGYQLMGDPEVSCGHIVRYPVSADDLAGVPADAIKKAYRDQHKYVLGERKKIEEQVKEIINA